MIRIDFFSQRDTFLEIIEKHVYGVYNFLLIPKFLLPFENLMFYSILTNDHHFSKIQYLVNMKLLGLLNLKYYAVLIKNNFFRNFRFINTL